MKKAELQDIHKVFETQPDSSGAVQRFTALDGVSLAFSPGEIHTILGENGAGKSTLVHILSGLHQPSRGSIRLGSRDVFFNSPSEALASGIAMVHQRPLLSDEISVLENILLGSAGFFLHKTRNLKTIETLAAQWNISLDLSAPAHALKPAGRLYTALLGALYRKPDFLVLDEPSAILVPEEREQFFRTLQKERALGLGIILITHKLDEAVRWSDRISILRRGKLVYTAETAHTETSSLPVTIDLLEGLLDPARETVKETKHQMKGKTQQSGTSIKDENTFTVSKISAEPEDKNPLRSITFTAFPGHITGIFGLQGSGIETLEDIISGMLSANSGSISVGHRIFNPTEINPSLLRKEGIAIVPSDRSFRGAHPDLSIFDMLTAYRTGPFFLPQTGNSLFVKSILAEEEIDAPFSRAVKTLSGGQLQRLILARCLATKPRILILAEPEWGLDVRSANLLRSRLLQAASDGATIIILTDDLDSLHDTDFYSDTLLLQEGVLS